MSQVDLNKYKDFVEAVTSKPSQDLTEFMNRLDRVDANYESYGPDGEYNRWWCSPIKRDCTQIWQT